MTVVDVSGWGKRNLWQSPSGQMIVRNGLRKIHSPESGYRYVGGFTERCERTGETFHFLVDMRTTKPYGVRIHVMDAAFSIFQTFQTGAEVEPQAVTRGVVFNEIMIGLGPDIPLVWGRLGVGLTWAVAQDSVSGSSKIDPLPRGIVTSWNTRIVVGDGRKLYVSDPVALGGGTIRSFIGANVNQRPGIVYGLHEGAGGMLVVVTSSGVYGLDSAASAVGVVGSNGADWRMLNHITASSYLSSNVVRGRVFGLTQGGFSLIDVESDSERVLSDLEMVRGNNDRIFMRDWRLARIFGGELGPVFGHSDQQAIGMFDMISGTMSWWTHGDPDVEIKLRGTLQDIDGDQLLLCEAGVFRLDGDFDGDVALSSVATYDQPWGGFFGKEPVIPSQNRDVREVYMAAANGGRSQRITLRGDSETATADADPEGLTIGTDVWDDPDSRLTTTPMSDVRVVFGQSAAFPGREMDLEVEAQGCGVRICPAIDVADANGAKRRPTVDG